jgi:hypothetical protein
VTWLLLLLALFRCLRIICACKPCLWVAGKDSLLTTAATSMDSELSVMLLLANAVMCMALQTLSLLSRPPASLAEALANVHANPGALLVFHSTVQLLALCVVFGLNKARARGVSTRAALLYLSAMPFLGPCVSTCVAACLPLRALTRAPASCLFFAHVLRYGIQDPSADLSQGEPPLDAAGKASRDGVRLTPLRRVLGSASWRGRGERSAVRVAHPDPFWVRALVPLHRVGQRHRRGLCPRAGRASAPVLGWSRAAPEPRSNCC